MRIYQEEELSQHQSKCFLMTKVDNVKKETNLAFERLTAAAQLPSSSVLPDIPPSHTFGLTSVRLGRSSL